MSKKAGRRKKKSGAATAPAATVRGWLEANDRRFAGKACIESIDQDKSITHGEMYRLSNRIARFLAARGVQANDRIALLSNNSIEHLAAYVGVLAYGATICTIHVEMNQVYVDEILAAVNPRLVLYEEGLDFGRPAAAAPGEWMALGELGSGGSSGLFAELADLDDSGGISPVNTRADIASLFYTSGTASKPKGVLCSYAQLCDNAAEIGDAFGMTADDRILDYRSYNWVSAQVLSALAPLAKGATLVMARRFSQSRFFDWVRDFRATIAAGNPTVINMLINRPVAVTAADLPHLRFMTSSSAPLMVEQWKAFEDLYGIPIAQGYGTSETIWIAGSNEATRRIGSVGRPLPGQRVAVVDGDGKALPAGETGIIEAGGDADAEYRYLAEDGSVRVHARGRMITGDMGYFDGDGYLYITGRVRDLIIRGGVNISPTEIDNVVLQLPEIAEAAAVGVADPIYGEEVVVYVARKPDADIDADAILAHCSAVLPHAKMPKQVIFRDGLPKTERGKLDRKALADEWNTTDPAAG